jgi:hypothetical protein
LKRRDRSTVAEFRLQPGAGELPIAHDGVWRDGEHFGRFFNTEAAEETQFDNAGFALVNGSESVKRVVQGDQLTRPTPTDVRQLFQIDLLCVAASLARYPAASLVKKDVAHDEGRDCEKMRPVLPVNIRDINLKTAVASCHRSSENVVF